MSPTERIQKILAERGLASRRKAEDLIREGRVTVNGRTAAIGEKADPEKDAIKVDGRRLAAPPQKAYVLFYKPRKVITTLRDPEERTSVPDLVAFPNLRLFPVGRLDFDAEGLILLTNDGDLAQRLAHPSHEVPRTYWVKVKGKPEKEEMERLRRGIRLEDGVTAPCTVQPLRETEGNIWVEMVLHEGRNRQVKRMWEKLGYPVLKLKRVGFGGLKLGDLQPGEYRVLRPEEVRKLKGRAVSAAAHPPSAPRPAAKITRRKVKE
jgi:23S rRNA pseudouridine2605 synthase